MRERNLHNAGIARRARARAWENGIVSECNCARAPGLASQARAYNIATRRMEACNIVAERLILVFGSF